MSEHYDIAIIGAGPSGCACALALQNKVLNIALIDKYTFPRKKVCGDAIPGNSFKAIDYINPQWGKELRSFSKGVTISKIAVYGMNGQQIVKNWNLFSYNCKRYDFDNYLLDLVRKQTNVTLIENKKVKKTKTVNDEIHCSIGDRELIKAKLIIGCDGANSVVKRELLPLSEGRAKNNFAFGVMSYFKGIEGLEHEQNEVYHIKKYPNGYFWIFPVENGLANVGFGILPSNKSQTKVNVPNALKDIIAHDPNVSPRFKSAEMLNQFIGAFLPLGGKKMRISGNRFMLCGDAASLIDPISGAGIDNAIWSGVYAAEQADKCFKLSNFSSNMMLEYDKVVYHNLGIKLRKNHIIMRLIIRYPRIVNVILKVLSK